MVFTYKDYCQYLLTSLKNYTLTNLANHLSKVSHDRIKRALEKTEINSDEVWKNTLLTLEKDEEASLIFDDTVLDKRSSQKIELVLGRNQGKIEIGAV